MDFSFVVDRNNPLPLYAQLADALQSAIRSGKLSYGEKLPSENEFVDMYGLSRMTVRTALAQLASENYVRKQHGKGTFVCYQAEHMITGKINVLLDVTYAYFSSHYIKSIAEVLTENKYQFVIHDTQNSQETICNILERILSDDCSAILLQPSHMAEPTSPRLKQLIITAHQHGIPCIILDSMIDEFRNICVCFNDYLASRIAAEYLLSLGHKKFAMVCCSQFSENVQRFNGFNSVLLEHGLSPLFPVEKDENLAQNLISLVKNEGITAVFNYNDEVALSTFHYLAEAKLRIPDDVSVLGFDDTVLAKATDPQMTCVIHPKELLGRIAADWLIHIVEHKPYEYSADLLFPRLRIRESCGRVKQENG